MNNKYLELRNVLSDMGLNAWTIVRDTWTGKGVCVFDRKGMNDEEFEKFRKYTDKYLTTPLEEADGFEGLWSEDLYAYFLPEHTINYVQDVQVLRDYADDMYGLSSLDDTYDIKAFEDTYDVDDTLDEWIAELKRENDKEKYEETILDNLLYSIALELLSEDRSEEILSDEEAEEIFDWFFGVEDDEDDEDEEDDDDSWYWY